MGPEPEHEYIGEQIHKKSLISQELMELEDYASVQMTKPKVVTQSWFKQRADAQMQSASRDSAKHLFLVQEQSQRLYP